VNRGRSGLIALSDGVRAYFEANRIDASVPAVGWRQRTMWTNEGPGGGSRVIFMPGQFDGGLDSRPLKGGSFHKARQTHDDPRPLVWWARLATLSVWAVDPDRPDDEELQIAATEDLLEKAVSAAHNAIDPVTGSPVGLADLIWGDLTWVRPPSDAAFGREILLTFTHGSALFDLPIGIATPQGAVARDPPT